MPQLQVVLLEVGPPCVGALPQTESVPPFFKNDSWGMPAAKLATERLQPDRCFASLLSD